MDLVEFLTARLSEDEQMARAAMVDGDPAAGRWERVCFHRTAGQPVPHEDDCCRVEGVDILIYDEGGHDPDQAEHIARHDPARVLADVAAKRRLLATLDGDPFDAMGAEGAYELLVAKHLALPYADHPDYRPEWAPDTADA